MTAARAATKDPPRDAPDADPAALAENHLIGSLLHLDAQAARDALRWVTPQDFADPQLRQIAHAIGNLAADGLDPQPALIVPRMVRDGLLPQQLAGLANAKIIDLLAGVPLPQSWPYYAATVADAAARRHLIAVAQRLQQAATTDTLETCFRLLSVEAEQARVRLARTGGPARDHRG